MERSCSKGTPTVVTLPQEPGLMPLQCAPRPPLSLCHVHVFSTRPLLLHMELASLTANATFFFPLFSTVLSWQCQEEFGGKWEKKGENLNANKNRCLIQHAISWEIWHSSAFLPCCNETPLDNHLHPHLCSHPPHSWNSSLISLLNSFRDIPGDYKHSFHIFRKSKQWKGAIRPKQSAGLAGDAGELSKNQQKRRKIKSESDKGWKTFEQRIKHPTIETLTFHRYQRHSTPPSD